MASFPGSENGSGAVAELEVGRRAGRGLEPSERLVDGWECLDCNPTFGLQAIQLSVWNRLRICEKHPSSRSHYPYSTRFEVRRSRRRCRRFGLGLARLGPQPSSRATIRECSFRHSRSGLCSHSDQGASAPTPRSHRRECGSESGQRPTSPRQQRSLRASSIPNRRTESLEAE